MKKTMIILIMLLIAVLLIGCTQRQMVQLVSLNAPEQIIRELIVGDIEGSLDPFRSDARDEALTEKMTGYAELLDGRDYLRCECLDYEVTGSRQEGLCEETTYHRITLKDDTVFYAICECLTDENGDGLVSFSLYTECPW